METKIFIDNTSIINCPDNCGMKPTENAMRFLYFLSAEYYTKFGKKLIVTSGARCFSHNKEVGGVSNSAHTRGLAFDVHYDNSKEAYMIVSCLYKMDVPRIGINFSKMFIHFDIDMSLPHNVLFKY